MNKVLTCAEVMRTLRVSRRTVRDLIVAGQLRGFRHGGVVRVTAESVEALLDDFRRVGALPREGGDGIGAGVSGRV